MINKLLNKLSQFLLCTKWIDKSLLIAVVYTTAMLQRGSGNRSQMGACPPLVTIEQNGLSTE
jgi:hypothetical protein